MVTLNRAVALAMVRGPPTGLDLLATLEADDRMARHHRLHAVRAHLLERAGDDRGRPRQLPHRGAPRDERARAPLPRRQGRDVTSVGGVVGWYFSNTLPEPKMRVCRV